MNRPRRGPWWVFRQSCSGHGNTYWIGQQLLPPQSPSPMRRRVQRLSVFFHQTADMPQCGSARQGARQWLGLFREACLSHGLDDSPCDLWRNPDRCAPAATAEARVQDQQARARSLLGAGRSKLLPPKMTSCGFRSTICAS